MTTRRRLRLTGFVAGAVGLLATALAVVTTSAVPAHADTPQHCFNVIDGKVHVIPGCLTPGPTSPPIMAVNLRAHSNGAYVTPEDAGASPLINNRWGVGNWERFALSMQSDGTVAIRALINNRYVSVTNGGGGPLIASQTGVGQWERFTVVDNTNGSVSLRDAAGRVVVADAGGAQPLRSSMIASGPTVEFDLLTAPTFVRTIALRAHANLMFVSTASGPLIANRASVGSTERFNQYQLADGRVALQSSSTGAYVTAENAGASPLIADRWGIGPWESFAIVDNADGSISLRAAANDKIVVAESGGASALIANRDGIGPWEEFDVVAA